MSNVMASEQDPNAGNVGLIVASTYRVPKSVTAGGDFKHFQPSELSTLIIAFDWQGMTSY